MKFRFTCEIPEEMIPPDFDEQTMVSFALHASANMIHEVGFDWGETVQGPGGVVMLIERVLNS